MEHLFKTISATCIVILFTGCRTSPQAPPDQTHQASMGYQHLLKAGIERGFPGIILGVSKGHEPVWVGAAGFSNLEEEISMTEPDQFHIASVTKLFTAIAILQLIDQNQIRLDDFVFQLIDEKLLSGIPYANDITVANLLDHSSGIYAFNNDLEYVESLIGDTAFEERQWSDTELLALAHRDRAEPQGTPGSGHYYSDTNYVILKLLMESVTKRPFREAINHLILRPLKLEHTGFYYQKSANDQYYTAPTIEGYLKRSEVIDDFISINSRFTQVLPNLYHTSIAGERLDASSGLVSNAKDLLTLGNSLYREDLLSQQSLAWLLSIGNDLNAAQKDVVKQGVVTARYVSYGLVYTSLGDGPGGTNVMLAYHPDSNSLIVAFTNIFGNFDEHDFFIDELVPAVIKGK